MGPDNSGKTTLANNLKIKSVGTDRPLISWKANAATSYKDYMNFLHGPKCDPLDINTHVPGLALNMEGAVICDRFFYCEMPYAHVLRGNDRIQWSLKQWHNLHLLTLAFNPLILLSTRRSLDYQDAVPEAMFDPILKEYEEMLQSHNLRYWHYDYQKEDLNLYLQMEAQQDAAISWWRKDPLFGVGNTLNPTVFIMAQDLGPSNVHRIPFEQGPSGYYLSDLLDGKDLGSYYLTNYLKSPDMGRNVDLLHTELSNLRPTHVILLGKEAEQSGPILDQYVAHTNVHSVVHPGWVVNHSSGIPELKRRKLKFEEKWEEIWQKISPA